MPLSETEIQVLVTQFCDRFFETIRIKEGKTPLVVIGNGLAALAGRFSGSVVEPGHKESCLDALLKMVREQFEEAWDARTDRH